MLQLTVLFHRALPLVCALSAVDLVAGEAGKTCIAEAALALTAKEFLLEVFGLRLNHTGPVFGLRATLNKLLGSRLDLLFVCLFGGLRAGLFGGLVVFLVLAFVLLLFWHLSNAN